MDQNSIKPRHIFLRYKKQRYLDLLKLEYSEEKSLSREDSLKLQKYSITLDSQLD